MKKLLSECEGFQWDDKNQDKIRIRHKVTKFECEEIFFNQPLLIGVDSKHSQNENRYFVLGRSDRNRFLFTVFTIRNNLIRVISARDMNNKEKRKYEERLKKYSKTGR